MASLYANKDLHVCVCKDENALLFLSGSLHKQCLLRVLSEDISCEWSFNVAQVTVAYTAKRTQPYCM